MFCEHFSVQPGLSASSSSSVCLQRRGRELAVLIWGLWVCYKSPWHAERCVCEGEAMQRTLRSVYRSPSLCSCALARAVARGLLPGQGLLRPAWQCPFARQGRLPQPGLLWVESSSRLKGLTPRTCHSGAVSPLLKCSSRSSAQHTPAWSSLPPSSSRLKRALF